MGLFKNNRKGQNVTEYLVLIAGVLVVLVATTHRNGMFTRGVNKSVDMMVTSLENMVGVQCLGTIDDVNGGWSEWSGWSVCVNCSQSQSRSCNSPPQRCNGAPCVGAPTNTQPCVGTCGDSYVCGSEQCDDSNNNNMDACTNTCQNNICGDGFLYVGVEQCDDGNIANNDSCSSTCRTNVCGDGNVFTGVEQCDDGNVNNNDACTNGCRNNVCGDGIRNTGVEQCDDGNTNNNDSCLNTCRSAFCGDGFIRTGFEDCEGSSTGGATCQSLGEGNGTLTCSGCRYLRTSCERTMCINATPRGTWNTNCNCCRFSRPTCPSPWYQSGCWSSTASQYCIDPTSSNPQCQYLNEQWTSTGCSVQLGPNACVTGSHGFSNNCAIETCTIWARSNIYNSNNNLCWTSCGADSVYGTCTTTRNSVGCLYY